MKIIFDSNVWNYGHCLLQVHFSGGVNTNYIPIKKDNGMGIYSAPQFVKSHPGGCLNSSGGSIVQDDPVAYVSGTKAKVKAVFETDCTHSYFIRGMGPTLKNGNQIIFNPQQVTPMNGLVEYSWNDANISFTSDGAKYYEEFEILWQVSEDGINWVDIDKSINPLYVTHKAPIAEIPGDDGDGTQYRNGIGYEWYESLLHLSCMNADMKSTKLEIFEKI